MIFVYDSVRWHFAIFYNTKQLKKKHKNKTMKYVHWSLFGLIVFGLALFFSSDAYAQGDNLPRFGDWMKKIHQQKMDSVNNLAGPSWSETNYYQDASNGFSPDDVDSSALVAISDTNTEILSVYPDSIVITNTESGKTRTWKRHTGEPLEFLRIDGKNVGHNIYMVKTAIGFLCIHMQEGPLWFTPHVSAKDRYKAVYKHGTILDLRPYYIGKNIPDPLLLSAVDGRVLFSQMHLPSKLMKVTNYGLYFHNQKALLFVRGETVRISPDTTLSFMDRISYKEVLWVFDPLTTQRVFDSEVVGLDPTDGRPFVTNYDGIYELLWISGTWEKSDNRALIALDGSGHIKFSNYQWKNTRGNPWYGENAICYNDNNDYIVVSDSGQVVLHASSIPDGRLDVDQYVIETPTHVYCLRGGIQKIRKPFKRVYSIHVAGPFWDSGPIQFISPKGDIAYYQNDTVRTVKGFQSKKRCFIQHQWNELILQEESQNGEDWHFALVARTPHSYEVHQIYTIHASKGLGKVQHLFLYADHFDVKCQKGWVWIDRKTKQSFYHAVDDVKQGVGKRIYTKPLDGLYMCYNDGNSGRPYFLRVDASGIWDSRSLGFGYLVPTGFPFNEVRKSRDVIIFSGGYHMNGSTLLTTEKGIMTYDSEWNLLDSVAMSFDTENGGTITHMRYHNMLQFSGFDVFMDTTGKIHFSRDYLREDIGRFRPGIFPRGESTIIKHDHALTYRAFTKAQSLQMDALSGDLLFHSDSVEIHKVLMLDSLGLQHKYLMDYDLIDNIVTTSRAVSAKDTAYFNDGRDIVLLHVPQLEADPNRAFVLGWNPAVLAKDYHIIAYSAKTGEEFATIRGSLAPFLATIQDTYGNVIIDCIAGHGEKYGIGLPETDIRMNNLRPLPGVVIKQGILLSCSTNTGGDGFNNFASRYQEVYNPVYLYANPEPVSITDAQFILEKGELGIGNTAGEDE